MIGKRFAGILLLGCLLAVPQLSTGQVLIALVFGDKLNTGKLEFGLQGGLSYNNQTGLPASKYNRRLNLGLYFDIKLSDRWVLHPAVVVKSNLGARDIPPYSVNDLSLDTVLSEGSIVRQINYIMVPVTMKYRLWRYNYLEFGPVISFRQRKAIDTFVADTPYGTIKHEVDISDLITKFDGGLLFGVWHRFKQGTGVNVGVQYYLGLMNARRDDTLPRVENRVLYVNINIPVAGIGKRKDCDCDE